MLVSKVIVVLTMEDAGQWYGPGREGLKRAPNVSEKHQGKLDPA